MSFELTILGSTSALPTAKRFPTAHVLNVHERFFLIDCGEGTQMQLRNFNFNFAKINHIFISHAHGDHYFGLFGLIYTCSLLGRKNDLHIFCTKDLKTILEFNIKFSGQLNFKIVYHVLNPRQPELIFEDKLITIFSLPLKHRVDCCGFLFKEKKKPLNIRKDMIDFHKISLRDIVKIKEGEDYTTLEGKIIPNKHLTLPSIKPRSYAFCSDTAYNERLVEWVKNVDLLYHEATFMNDLRDRAKQTGHSTTLEAATIAKKANVEKLLIGHFSVRYRSLKEAENEAKTIFENTKAVKEGDRISLKEVRRS